MVKMGGRTRTSSASGGEKRGRDTKVALRARRTGIKETMGLWVGCFTGGEEAEGGGLKRGGPEEIIRKKTITVQGGKVKRG